MVAGLIRFKSIFQENPPPNCKFYSEYVKYRVIYRSSNIRKILSLHLSFPLEIETKKSLYVSVTNEKGLSVDSALPSCTYLD